MGWGRGQGEEDVLTGWDQCLKHWLRGGDNAKRTDEWWSQHEERQTGGGWVSTRKPGQAENG